MNKMSMKFVAGLLLCFAVSVPGAHAIDYFPNYERIRVLGMGGAFTALSDTPDAPFYNPAGLNSLSRGTVTIFDPMVEGSQDFYDTYREWDSVNTDNEVEISNFLKQHVGTPEHFRFMLTPGYARKNFALYMLANACVDARIRNQADPIVDLLGVGDVGGQVSGAYGFKDGMYQVGATLRVVRRTSVDKAYTSRDLMDENLSFDNDALTGTGVSGDVGAIVTFPMTMSPSIGLVIKDIGSPPFGDAVKNQQDVRLGFGAKRDFDPGRLKLALDVRRIGYSEDFWKKVYLGGEFSFKKYLSLRAGLYQGYLAAGATLDLWFVHLSYATYAAEVGMFPGQVADRRHALQLAFEY